MTVKGADESGLNRKGLLAVGRAGGAPASQVSSGRRTPGPCAHTKSAEQAADQKLIAWAEPGPERLPPGLCYPFPCAIYFLGSGSQPDPLRSFYVGNLTWEEKNS